MHSKAYPVTLAPRDEEPSLSSSQEQAPDSYLYENYNNNYYMDIYLFPNLIVKESYNWWLTRRVWGFRQQKSEEKYPNVSVANIGKH